MELTVSDFWSQSANADGDTQEVLARRPVDLVHLARCTFGNESQEREILALFRNQTKHCLKRLKQASHEKAWKIMAHTIKDSASEIGAWRLARTAANAEALQGNTLAVRRKAAVAALQRDVDETNAFIQGLLATKRG